MVSCSGDPSDKNLTQLPVIDVKTGEVTGVGHSKHITASGKIETENSANLSTRMMGFVSSVNVKTGQKVSKGQLLLSINNSDLQAKKPKPKRLLFKHQRHTIMPKKTMTGLQPYTNNKVLPKKN